MIYLDYNATTPLAPSVFAAMRPYLERHFGNPSSIHSSGREARAAIDNARDRIAARLQSKSHEIIFTGGGTEADNLAIIGLARAHAPKGKHLITATTEHPAVLQSFEYLQKNQGFNVTWLNVDRHGRIDLNALADACTPSTTLVSIMTANNETGTIQPISEISALCRSKGILFHSDAIQSFGKDPLNTQDFDALSITGHKFHGPKGAGLLYLKAGQTIDPLQYGGSHENTRRPGTENTAAIVGLSHAVDFALDTMDAERPRQTILRDRLWDGIQSLYPRAIRNGSPEHSLANTLNVSFPNLNGESLLISLDLAGLCASSGSACMVGSILASHVLLAMGVPPDLAQSSVRFSLGHETTTEEIDSALRALPAIFARLTPD
jgi:cysteine desulfurase